ncbi:ArnT family glycosyltransferase [Hymenobacter cheonanensis]|uniref:ArnT family glycosyltransferase n=1 Tax=Hymenobacter sp. CA2-7 TaxID=3063993 RepID=UPI0027137DC2|nr:glycosyltransferase family 39 protein [Hymenobacter sp. CA2-7]MDO7887660.1 glycosyltransferase family 39 protein [Hymenobacter sp. CA2-7]
MVESLARRVLIALSQRPWWVAGLTLALALPALLLHLGWQPLLVDEPIRALVALEMHYSGHFFGPTLQGLPYYNKPPLFNWLLVALFRLFGRQDEFMLRLPTIVALLLYTTALWRVLRPQLGSRLAFTVALAFATTGRVLFYDSFLGLIDLWHAGLTWLGFMAVWYLGQRGQWARLFVLTYALTAVGFLLKGLPSVVFQGLALLVYCLDTRQWRRLFSWQHVLGVGVMLSIVGAYFLIYSQHNSLETALATLWSQSSQRVVTATPLAESVRYMLLFPFDFIKHFLPWTLLVLCLLVPGARRTVLASPFLRYNALLFLAILPVYWLSPATIPRYLFMLVPLGLTVVVALYARYWPAQPVAIRLLDGLLLGLLVASTLLVLAPPLLRLAGGLGLVAPARLAVLRGVPASGLLTLAFVGPLALGAYLFWRLADYRLLVLGYYLLVLRLAFDVFIFPARMQTSPEVTYRTDAIRVGRETKGRPLVLYPEGGPLDNVEAFYIARERGQTLTFAPLPLRPHTLYIIDEHYLSGLRYRTLDTFTIDRDITFRVVEFDLP